MASTHPPAAGDSSTLYAAVEGRIASLGTDEAVFFEASTGRSQVMTQDVARAFGLCQPFLTLDEHLARIVEALPSLKGQKQAVRKVLDMFVSNRLLRSDVDFVSEFAAPAETAQAPVSGLYLLCASEPADGLDRALAGLRAHASRFGLAYPVYVVDTDAAPDAVPSRAARVADFGRGTGAAMRYLTRQSAEAVVKALTQSLGERAQAIAALLPPKAQGAGAARNLVALLAAGTRHLVIEADMELPLARHPEAAAGLYADTRAYALRSFASGEDARQAGGVPAVDPLAAHLAVCGLNLGEALALQSDAAPTRESLHGVIPERAPWLRPERRVALTAVGRVGRFALTDPTLPFQLGPTERAGLTATREAYLDNYRMPSLWAGLNRFGAGLGERLVPLAYDGSRLIPCTLPEAPKAMELQVELLRLAQPDAVDLDFPEALGQGHPGRGADDGLGRPDLAKCLAGLVAHVGQDLYAADAARRLAVLAAKLEDLAGATDARVETYLAEFLAWHRSGIIERMQQMTGSEKSPPVYWLADLRAAVQAQGKVLIEGEAPRLAGWPASLDAAGCVQRFREETHRLAAGLRAWPDAFELACAQSSRWRDATA